MCVAMLALECWASAEQIMEGGRIVYKFSIGWEAEEMEFDSLLDALERASVFNIEKIKDGTYMVGECCDNVFGLKLTREQILTLSDEIKNLVG